MIRKILISSLQITAYVAAVMGGIFGLAHAATWLTHATRHLSQYAHLGIFAVFIWLLAVVVATFYHRGPR